MGGKSNIEWTGHTWNPLVGCTVLSPGCTNCYAMQMAARLELMGQERYAGTTKKIKGKSVWTGVMRRAPEATLLEPLRRKKPTTYFVNSMSDLFHEDVPDEWIDQVFAVMALASQHTFQVLTKRAERMRSYMTQMTQQEWWKFRVYDRSAADAGALAGWGPGLRPSVYPDWPFPNVWLGVSAERQQEADERIPHLLETPAAVRFISAEPLLGPIDLKRWMPSGRWGTFEGQPVFNTKYFMTRCEHCGWFGSSELVNLAQYTDDADCVCPSCDRIFICDEVARGPDWLIVGGESGHDARLMHPDWARSLRDQCKAGNVAFFFKQHGEFKAVESSLTAFANQKNPARLGERIVAADGTFEGFPPAGVTTFQVMRRVGKSNAGRLLDGVEHNGMPERISA